MKVIAIASLLVTSVALVGGAYLAQAPVITDPDKVDTPPPAAKTEEGDGVLPAPLVIPEVEKKPFEFAPQPASPFNNESEATNPSTTTDQRAAELQKEFAGGGISGGETEGNEKTEATEPTGGEFKIPSGGEFSIPIGEGPLAIPKEPLTNPLEGVTDPPTQPSGDPKIGDPVEKGSTDSNEPAIGGDSADIDTNTTDLTSPADPEVFDPKFVAPTDPAQPADDEPLNPRDPLESPQTNPVDPQENIPEEKIEAPDPLNETGDNTTDVEDEGKAAESDTSDDANRPAPAFRIPESTKAPSRLWMDSSARFTLTASFVSVKEGTVVLRHTDGGDWNIAVSQLSQKDQGYIWAYDNPTEAKAMRSWSNGQYAEFVYDGSTKQRGNVTTSSGVQSTLSVDSLSAYDQGVLEALVGMGK